MESMVTRHEEVRLWGQRKLGSRICRLCHRPALFALAMSGDNKSKYVAVRSTVFCGCINSFTRAYTVDDNEQAVLQEVNDFFEWFKTSLDEQYRQVQEELTEQDILPYLSEF